MVSPGGMVIVGGENANVPLGPTKIVCVAAKTGAVDDVRKKVAEKIVEPKRIIVSP